MAKLLTRFHEANRRYRLLSGGERVLVAVSGGPDSVALLHLLHTQLPELHLALGVAHLHHGLRGAEADADAEYVAALAAKLALPYHTERADATGYAAEHGLSLEMAARKVRYAFLERVAEAQGYGRIALGHTASDRVETALMHLLQGTGLPGLRGMPPARGRILRPLLTAWRSETEAYCREYALEPRADETNLDPTAALRNRIRHELLPHLREQYNPAVDEALLRLAEAAEAELEWTAPQVEAAFTGVTTEREGGLGLDLEGLAALPVGLRLRVWREAWTRLHGGSLDLRSAHYEALEHLLGEAQTGREASLPGDIRAQKLYNEVFLSPCPTRPEPGPRWAAREVPLDGEAEVPVLGVMVSLRALPERPTDLGEARGRLITLDAEAVRLPITMRPWQPGDELAPLGMDGHKKLQDLFVDEKVPAADRERVPVFADAAGEIVWVAGLAMSDRCKITAATRQYLQLSLEKADAAH